MVHAQRLVMVNEAIGEIAVNEFNLETNGFHNRQLESNNYHFRTVT